MYIGNILVPTKREILTENCEEGNCADHYHYNRAVNEAYWAAILYAYDTSKRGLSERAANMLAWQEFAKEVDAKDFGMGG